MLSHYLRRHNTDLTEFQQSPLQHLIQTILCNAIGLHELSSIFTASDHLRIEDV